VGDAFFLAAVQVLVYAGAVMVLFLFVIMLLDLKAEERRKIKALGIGGVPRGRIWWRMSDHLPLIAEFAFEAQS